MYISLELIDTKQEASSTTWYDRHFAKNYCDLSELKETAVRRLKDLQKSNWLQSSPPKKSNTDDSEEDEDTYLEKV